MLRSKSKTIGGKHELHLQKPIFLDWGPTECIWRFTNVYFFQLRSLTCPGAPVEWARRCLYLSDLSLINTVGHPDTLCISGETCSIIMCFPAAHSHNPASRDSVSEIGAQKADFNFLLPVTNYLHDPDFYPTYTRNSRTLAILKQI